MIRSPNIYTNQYLIDGASNKSFLQFSFFMIVRGGEREEIMSDAEGRVDMRDGKETQTRHSWKVKR